MSAAAPDDPDPPAGRPPRVRAFLLLEAMLAVAVFSLVAVALSVSLQRTLASLHLAQMEMYVQEELASRIALGRLTPAEAGRREEPPDRRGVRYICEIRPLNLNTKKMVPVSNLQTLRWTAVWRDGDGEHQKSLQVYVRQR